MFIACDLNEREEIEEGDLYLVYLALTDKLDWVNPEGNRPLVDLSKPLPLQEKEGRLIIPIEFFFNNNLEYLKTGNKERKYTVSMTKTKAARRVDKKEYKFREANFLRLDLNDIKDMFLVYVQGKMYNLEGHEIVDLVNVIRMFTKSIVVKKRVKGVQLGVESYQKKLNVTRPQTTKLMRDDELFKFCDLTLKSIREVLHYRLTNFKLGYNARITMRAWTDKDHNQIATILKEIDDLLLKRRIMQSLECFVGEK
ncbi:hypothetical protein Tco_1549319 [Tanacetum coccineum]